MKKNIKTICEIAVLSALGCCIDLLGTLICSFAGNGFCISLGFVSIAFCAYKLGWKNGLICGIITGLLELIYASFLGGVIDIVQAIIEYPVALSLFGFCGIFRNNILENNKKKYVEIIIPLFIICLIKIMLHTIIGVIYWETSFSASLLLNSPYILISFALSCPILIIVTSRLNKTIK